MLGKSRAMTDTTLPSPALNPVGELAGRHLLLGVTGGVAAFKACEFARELQRRGATVQVVMTEAATHFIGTATFAATATNVPLLTGSAAAVTATSTQIIITTAGAATGTGSVRVTLSGLTLGPAQAAGICSLTTFADACISPASQFPLTAIRAATTPAAVVASSVILLPWVNFVTAVAILVAALAF